MDADIDSKEVDEGSEQVDDDGCYKPKLDISDLLSRINRTEDGGFDFSSLFSGLDLFKPSPTNTSRNVSGAVLGTVTDIPNFLDSFNTTLNGTSGTTTPKFDFSGLLGGLTSPPSNATSPKPSFDFSSITGEPKESSYKIATNLIWQIVPPLVIVLGSIGNILTILVMLRQLRRSSTAVFLVALAISDIMILYCGPLREWIRQLRESDVRNYSVGGCKMSTYITYSSLQLSSWLLVVVTMQRVIVVRWPHRRHLRCSTRGALGLIAILFVIIYGLNAHFIYGMGNSTLPKYIGRGKCHPLYGSYVNFHNEIWPWVDFAVVFALPFLILGWGNLIIIIQVNKQRVLRRRMSVGSERAGTVYEKDTRMITTMLILLSVVFFICTVPSTIYFILRPQLNKRLDRYTCLNDLKGYVQLHEAMMFWHAVTGCVSYLNATLNFILYVMSGTKFRKEIVATMCCRPLPDSRSHSGSSRNRHSRLSSVSKSFSSSVSDRKLSHESRSSRLSSVQASGIEKLLLKMKMRRQSDSASDKERRGSSRSSSVDTTISTIIDNNNENDISNKNHDIDQIRPRFSRCHTLPESEEENDIANISNSPYRKTLCESIEEEKDMNIDPITSKVDGLMNTRGLAITQLCKAMIDNTKFDNNINDHCSKDRIQPHRSNQRKLTRWKTITESEDNDVDDPVEREDGEEEEEAGSDKDEMGLDINPISYDINAFMNHPQFLSDSRIVFPMEDAGALDLGNSMTRSLDETDDATVDSMSMSMDPLSFSTATVLTLDNELVCDSDDDFDEPVKDPVDDVDELTGIHVDYFNEITRNAMNDVDGLTGSHVNDCNEIAGSSVDDVGETEGSYLDDFGEITGKHVDYVNENTRSPVCDFDELVESSVDNPGELVVEDPVGDYVTASVVGDRAVCKEYDLGVI